MLLITGCIIPNNLINIVLICHYLMQMSMLHIEFIFVWGTLIVLYCCYEEEMEEEEEETK